ncbi:MAG: hypothetical protein Q7T71_04970 [Herbiconiux sp.]|nr:hypothetical protein [Herbiconiux sp.]
MSGPSARTSASIRKLAAVTSGVYSRVATTTRLLLGILPLLLR